MIDYPKMWNDPDIFRCTCEAAVSVLEEESNAYLFTLRDEALILLNIDGSSLEVMSRTISILSDGKLEHREQIFDTPSDVAHFLFNHPFINPRRIRRSTPIVGPLLANNLDKMHIWLPADQIDRAVQITTLNQSNNTLQLCMRFLNVEYINQGVLQAAASVGNCAVVEWLINECGVNVNQAVEGRTALWWATTNHHVSTVGTLLANGADSENGICCIKTALESGDLETAVQITSMLGLPTDPLHRAARNPNPEVFEWLYDAYQRDLEACNKYGERPLEVAIKARELETVALILELGSVPNDLSLAYLPQPTTDRKRELICKVVQYSKEPLASLIQHLKEQTVLYLIKIGVIKGGSEAVEAAVQNRCALTLSYLVPDDANLFQVLKNQEAKTISSMTSGLLHCDRIDVLHQLAKSVQKLPYKLVRSALSAQCERYNLRHRAVDDLILTALELADLTQPELQSQELLGMAIEAGRVDLVRVLLNAGATPTEEECLLAADRRDPELMRLLEFDFSHILATNSDHTLLQEFCSDDCIPSSVALDCQRAVRPDESPIASIAADLAPILKKKIKSSDIETMVVSLVYSLFFNSSLYEVNQAMEELPGRLREEGVGDEICRKCYEFASKAYETIQNSGHLIARPLSPAHQVDMALAYSKQDNFCQLQSEFMRRRSVVYQDALAQLQSGELSTLEQLTYFLSSDRSGLSVKMRRQLSGRMVGAETQMLNREIPTLRYGQFAPLIEEIIARVATHPDYHPDLLYSQSDQSYTVFYTLGTGSRLPLTQVIWNREPVLMAIHHSVGDLSELIDEAENRFQRLLMADTLESNELATLYWILCQLTLKQNGSAQSSLETHNLLRELKQLPVYPVARQTFLLDVLALILPLDIFLSIYDDCFDRPDAPVAFDPIVDRDYLN